MIVKGSPEDAETAARRLACEESVVCRRRHRRSDQRPQSRPRRELDRKLCNSLSDLTCKCRATFWLLCSLTWMNLKRIFSLRLTDKGTVPMLIKVLFGAVLFFSVASFVLGQQNTGALKGTVTDQLGSLVVGAKVTLRDARGVSTTANTNSAGVYEFRRLEAGEYELMDRPAGAQAPVRDAGAVLDAEVRAEDAVADRRSCSSRGRCRSRPTARPPLPSNRS